MAQHTLPAVDTQPALLLRTGRHTQHVSKVG